MMEAEAFANAVAERAAAVLSGRTSRTETYSIGRLPFEIHAPAGQAGDWIGRAFSGEQAGSQHRRTAHCISIWDGIDRRELPPRAPWDPTEAEPLGVYAKSATGAVRCAVDIHTDSLMVCYFARNHSYVWFPSIAALPPWAKASPFRIVLSWLCNQERMQIVHGAAVAINGRAVLLAGDGGAGKSTTALACALAGFEYLGDDYCAVEPEAGRIHMVYRTAKLFKRTLELLPSLADLIENRDRIDVEKGVVFLNPDDVKLSGSADLAAILLPRVGDPGESRMLYPATREEAIKAILPSTIGGLMGGTAVTPRMIMQLVRSVPIYHLALKPDIKAVTEAVAAHLTAG